MAANHGALGLTFKASRILQFVTLIPLIGLASNTLSDLISSNLPTPALIVGTLSIACISTLYVVLTLILYSDSILPFLPAAAADSVFLIAAIVAAALTGRPLAYLNCQSIGSGEGHSAYEFSVGLGKDGVVGYSDWVAASRSNCLEMKAVWGLSIALCILFSFSTTCSVFLWLRKSAPAPKDVEA